ADRRLLILHQVGQVDVRLEDRAHQREVLLLERGLDAAEDFLQARAVHFDELRRGSHAAASGREGRLHRPFPWGRGGIATRPQWSKAAAIPQEPTKAGSSPRTDRPPVGECTRSRRVARGEQDRELMGGQALRTPLCGRGPPRKAALREPLVAEPEALAIVQEQLQRRPLAIAEDEDRADEGVVLEGFLAESRQAVDPSAKV